MRLCSRPCHRDSSKLLQKGVGRRRARRQLDLLIRPSQPLTTVCHLGLLLDGVHHLRVQLSLCCLKIQHTSLGLATYCIMNRMRQISTILTTNLVSRSKFTLSVLIKLAFFSIRCINHSKSASGLESWILYLRISPVFGRHSLESIMQAAIITCVQRPDINVVVVHDNDWIAVTSSDVEDIFGCNGTDYERLTTRVLEECQLQVAQGRLI